MLIMRGRRISEAKLEHAHSRRGQKTIEYLRWESMVRRCHNPAQQNYRYYGARGITVCDAWRGKGGFVAFLAHIGPCPGPLFSVDRINNARGYEPGNVRWATATQQMRNKTNNRLITANGVTMTLMAWAELLGMSHTSILGRIQRGMSEAEAVTKPPQPNNPRRRHLAPDWLHEKTRTEKPMAEEGRK